MHLPKMSGPDLDSSEEFAHPNVWERQQFTGWSRLAIGAQSNEIPLILRLCRELKGPFGILYVLLVSRLGRRPPARYQSPVPVDHDELERFLYTFQEFFEQDGRHHLWVMSLADDGQIIFDNHNVLYAYGNLDRYEEELAEMGFSSGQVETPAPHSHHYHSAFDSSEDDVMEYWSWKPFPLQPYDDP